MATTRRAAPHTEDTGSGNNEGSNITPGVEDIANKASEFVHSGLAKLDPQVVQLGQAAMSSVAAAAAPVRRALKSQPVLAGTGLFAIAAGGLLLGLAITRDNRTPGTPGKAD